MSERDLLPANELERIQALQRYQILDTPPDGAFDRITALAAQLANTPIAIVSLVDTDRIWFKSHYGLDVTEIDRVPGLCASAILEVEPYTITDASLDPRSLANPLVAGDFGLRFYAGIPLQTHDNYNLGVLCVIDFEPRDISEIELEMLSHLAELVMDQMELRLAARRVDELHRELVQTHAALRVQATHDSLTGLLNRGAVMERLTQVHALSCREQRSMSVAIADIDKFKQINDIYGHQAGDRVLIEVSQRLERTIRASDSLGRIGGEEFLLVMYPCDAEGARQTAERLRRAVCDRPIFIEAEGEATAIEVSISVGLFTPENYCTTVPKDILHYADTALYLSKSRGRNQVSVGTGA